MVQKAERWHDSGVVGATKKDECWIITGYWEETG